ncbi:metalloprotease [Hoyosella rhizosphaerae]|uniref:Metalloprotease n=1 Tax=Hoyosella rhizosphaerae TaxID=1755582 RepID=A0A916XCJ5_9ACTN|nr:metalloprotease [Hoyosella rhizosphaerae]
MSLLAVIIIGLFLLRLLNEWAENLESERTAGGGFTAIELDPAGPGSTPDASTPPPRTDPGTAQPVYELESHPLLATPNIGLPSASCPLAPWSTAPEQAFAHLVSAFECFETMWQPVLQARQLPTTPANLTVISEASSAVSPCTSSGQDFAAFYCPVNNMIYMPLDTLGVAVHGDRFGIYLAVLAHEYGHHVQNAAGLLDAQWQRRQSVGHNSAEALEVSRRTELQAQCFSGMAFASAQEGGTISVQRAQEAGASMYRSGDSNGPRTHGTPSNYGSWWEQGYQLNSTAMCNTWLAESSDVS